MTTLIDKIPQAKDGSLFLPELKNASGLYTVGNKGDEQKFERYADALAYLRAMPTPRWRRPNDNGNWGIVTGVRWITPEQVLAASRSPLA
ncbi:hypothetical protein [uncultured Ferrimonas sp.]|uniref:hypothetical protein n=1 Tax=uncultured Ferrimonas sp. TaxID=432640 RepID=UPI002635DB9E|nr:hypothetical protein [uncultured Ferrimonas sp.]